MNARDLIYDEGAIVAPEPSSRRALLSRLAGLGLVTAGSLVLPEEAEAKKAKKRAQRRHRGRRQGKPAGRDRQAGERQLTSQDYIPNPRIVHPIYTNRPPQFRVTKLSGGYVRVRADCKIIFTEEHKALMRAGRQYRVSCAVWESDGGSGHDYCFKFPQIHTFPARRDYPPSFAYPYFDATKLSSVLNHDVDDGWWDSDDDLDDPYGRITLETRPLGGVWTLLSVTWSNEAPGYY